MDELKSNFQFDGYKVEHIDYIWNSGFELKEPITVTLAMNVDIGLNDEFTKGSVKIQTSVFENAKENNYPFSLQIGITGFFSTQDKISEENFKKFLEINGTTALFPFLRSVIADITRVANLEPPLLMPLINIHALSVMQKQSEEHMVSLKLE
ncbi:MAG: protein-export chaperone SecB [Thermacetogeniaceae bacterium]|jgi:preprotein translocase subunit SecB